MCPGSGLGGISPNQSLLEVTEEVGEEGPWGRGWGSRVTGRTTAGMTGRSQNHLQPGAFLRGIEVEQSAASGTLKEWQEGGQEADRRSLVLSLFVFNQVLCPLFQEKC